MSDNKTLYSGLIRTNPSNTRYGDSLFFNNVDRFLTPRIPYEKGVTNETKLKLQEKYSGLPLYESNFLYNPSNFDVNVNYHQSVYNSQLQQWKALDEAVNSGKTYTMFGFDLETIGVSDTRKLSDTSVITEIGITKSKMKGRVEKDYDSFSIALGIDSTEQVEKYLGDIKLIRDSGSGSIKNKSERGLLESNIERLSRYSGDINDLYDKRNITGIGKDITVINKLAPSSGARTDAAIQGLFNESILGGVSAQQMEQSLKKTGLYSDDLMRDYISRQELFTQRGYSIQTQGSNLIDKAKKLIANTTQKSDVFSVGFNTTLYDIPILNQIGNTNKNIIDQARTIDVYPGYSTSANGKELLLAEEIARENKVGINYPGKVRQEGLARAFGESFDDTAHNAASDTHVANKLSLNVLDLLKDGDGVLNEVQNNGVDIFGENTVAFALDSIMYDKNGKDAFTVKGNTSEYYISGVKRNRFYNINKISQDEDGSVVVRFTSAGSNTDEIFDKSYNTVEDMVKSLKSTFVFRDKSTFGSDPQKVIDTQDSIYRADIARRNYDKLFDISSIETTEKGNFVGGYDRLNQYYQAYKATLFDDGTQALEPRDYYTGPLAKGVERNDEKLRQILIDNGLGYEKNGQGMVSDSVVQDFKQFYGKLQDESGFLGFLEQEFQKPENQNLNNYQRTLIANEVRNKITSNDGVTGIYKELSETDIAYGRGALLAGEQDLYRFELSGKVHKNAKDTFTASINFENKENATKHLYNSVMKEVDLQNAGNKNVAASLLMNSIVTDLYEREYVSQDFFHRFSADVLENSATNYQPWRQAEAIVSEIQTRYVNPMMEAGWSLEKLRDTAIKDKSVFVGTGAGQISEELYNMTISKMSNYSGRYLSKARNTRYVKDGTAYTLDNIVKFDGINLQEYFREASNKAAILNIDLSQDSIDEIREITKKYLGYDDETADTISRMLGMKDFGLVTKGWNSSNKKTDWITQFFQPGVKGANAFAFFTPTSAGSGKAAQVIKKLNEATPENYREIVEQIKDNGDAFVMELPASKEMAFLDESNERTKIFKGYDSAGNPIYETPKYKSMTYGKGNFQQVVRKKTNSYFVPGKAHTIENFEIKETDDLIDIAESYKVMRKSLDEILENEDLSTKEKMQQATRRFGKYQDKIMQDMASLNGARNNIEFIDETGQRVVKSVSIPTMGDMLSSSRVNLSSIQELYLRTVAEATSPQNIGNATEKDKAMARFIAQFSNDTRTNISDGEKLANIVEKLDSNRNKGNTIISQQFQEAYIKHFMGLGIQDGIGYSSFGLEGTIIDYLEEVRDRFSKSASNYVDVIYRNVKEGKGSQLLKGHDLRKNYMSLLNEQEWIPNTSMESMMRPTTMAQNNAESFVSKLFEEELGADNMKLYNIHIGNDAEPLQEAITRKVTANAELSYGLKMGDLAQGFSANFRNMSPAAAVNRMVEIENNFEQVFKSELTSDQWRVARGISQYKIDDNLNKNLIAESFNILKKYNLFNNNESKIILNPEVFNNVFGNTPYIKKGDFNGIIENETELQEVAQFLKGKHLTDGYNISKAYRKATGRTIGLSSLSSDTKDLTYKGYSGVLNGSVEDIANMLATQRAQVVNPIAEINDIKLQIGNEKGTGTNLPFLKSTFLKQTNNPYYEFQKMLYKHGIKDFDTQREITLKYVGNTFQKAYGEGIAAVTSAPFAKHINPVASNYLVEMFGIANDELLNGNAEASVQFKNLFRSAAQSTIENRKYDKDFVGIVPELLNGKLVVNRNELKEAGEIPQIEEAIRIAIERRDENPLYAKIADSFSDPIKEQNQVYRQYAIRTPNEESLGHSVGMTERAGVSYRMKGIENINEIVEYSKDAEYFNTFNINGERMTINDYIFKSMRDESYEGMDLQKRFVNNTVNGLMYSIENRTKPISTNASNILEVKLEDLVEITGKRTPESMLDYGMFKMMGRDGEALYSKQLQKLAGKRDLNDIQALRVLLPEGITYDIDEAKGLNAVLMPIMDVTPYKGELYLSDTARVMEDVIDTAKNFKQKGIKDSQERLNNSIKDMQAHFRNAIYGDKNSYYSKNITSFELKNAKRFFAKAATLPVVEGMVGEENYQKWLTSPEYRNKLISDISSGVANNTKLAEEGIVGNKRLSRITKDGKRVYDDIAFLSKQAYKDMGVDFVESGTDIFYNFERYNRMANLTASDDIRKVMNFEELNKLLEKRIKEQNIMKKFRAKNMDEAKAIVEHIVLGHNGYQKVNSKTRKVFKDFFEDVTSNYLENVGTSGIISRQPTFHGGSINSIIFKLDNTLAVDEHIITPALMHRLNEDFDGDQDVLKMLLDTNGKLLNDGASSGQGNYLYRAWEQGYKQYIGTGRNNRIMADLIKDQADTIVKTGGVDVDLARNLSRKDIYSKAQNLQKLLTNDDITKMQLTLENFKFSSLNEVTDLLKSNANNPNNAYTKQQISDISEIYDWYQYKQGNLLLNKMMQASAEKASFTKEEIGNISNVNYHINEALESSMKEILYGSDDIDKARLTKFQNIITDLHVENTGLLPIVEQTAIDVKHLLGGMEVAETPQYLIGMKQIFRYNDNPVKANENAYVGLKNVYKALKNNDKVIPANMFSNADDFANYILNTSRADISPDKGYLRGFRSIIDLSGELSREQKTYISGAFGQTIDLLKEEDDYFASVLRNKDFYDETTLGQLSRILNEPVNTFINQFQGARNGIINELKEDMIYFRSQQGDEFIHPGVYRYNGKTFNKKTGSYSLNFSNVVDDSDIYSVSGTEAEVQKILSRDFGDFKAVTEAEFHSIRNAERTASYSSNFADTIATSNAQRYLDIKARKQLEGTIYNANDFLSTADTRLRIPYGYEATEELLNKIDSSFESTPNAYVELRDSLRYIKYKDKKTNIMLDDALAELNQSIINNAKNKKTNTSVDNIFMSFLSRIGGEDIMDNITHRSEDYLNYTSNFTKGLRDHFSQFDSTRIDMRRAKRELEALNTENLPEVQKQIDDILNRYNVANHQQIYEGLKDVLSTVETKDDINTLFNLNSSNYGEMRVGLDAKNGNWLGRRFDSLDSEDIQQILMYSTTSTDSLHSYAAEETKNKLTEYLNYMKQNSVKKSQISGASNEDISSIVNSLNQNIRNKASGAAERTAQREAATETLKDVAKHKGKYLDMKVMSDAWETTKDFMGKHGKTVAGVGLAMAALNIVGNIMEPNDSPLSPELNAKPGYRGVGHGGKKAPASPNSTTVYANPSDGLNYKMSARSLKKINNMQAAQSISSGIGGSMDVSVHDDRSPVSDVWLQDKFSNLV